MLRIENIHSTDLNAALQELVHGAQHAFIGGQPGAALQALRLLQQPGAWYLPARGRLVPVAQQLFTLLCGLQGQDRPAWHGEPALTLAQWQNQSITDEHEVLSMLVMPVRNQLRPAGQGWSPTQLRAWAAEWASAPAANQAVKTGFALDAEWVLKQRLKQADRLDDGAPADQSCTDDDDGIDLMALLMTAVPVAIAPEADSVSNHELLAALSAQVSGKSTLAYDQIQLFGMLLVLGALLGDIPLAQQAGKVLLRPDSADGLAQMTQWGQIRAVADFYASGALADAAGVSAGACAQWLAALATRSAPAADKSALRLERPGTLINQPDDLAALCQGTPLQAFRWTSIPILDTDEVALGCWCPVDQSESLWRAARALLPQTGRWPLLVWACGDHGDDLAEQDFFSRFEYGHSTVLTDDISPSALIASAREASAEAFLQRLREQHDSDDWEESWQEWWENAKADTRDLLGSAPTEAALTQQAMQRHGKPVTQLHRLDWERLLWDWERQHVPPLPPEKLQWLRPKPFVPDNTALLLLPTREPWDALAYVNFFGLDDTAGGIALGREWQRRWGAELYAHWGTMLQCHVGRPPEQPEDALQLAHAHDRFAQNTLNCSLRHYAQGLLGRDFWFLHQRP
ncbi:DUF4253 domain-containing protein [Ottowia testudinis]|uniref:DUF4253 domain-containing protein n=1 Tax=Ottowia testudinis TaxID=2816950 RepID=A0A975H2J2_9BURK|nr:DUF4253 domain-containing protein [Ottowia testudinis]QTD44251.1 DUF4253 domain-containing protein [Ottowia testudinis]